MPQASGANAVKDFHFIFDAPPIVPSATSPVDEVFAWSVWRAMELSLKDVVFDESADGLVVGCLDYNRRGKSRGPKYHPLAKFPHLRGMPLKGFPAKGRGVVSSGNGKWNVRVWTCQKLAGDEFRMCAIVQLVPPPAA